MIELRTDKQIARDERNCAIAAYYQQIKTAHPEASDNAILKAMAKEGKHGLNTVMSVKKALISAGSYKTHRA